MNILVVDDDMALRGMLTMALELQGHTVHEAENRESAIAALRQHAFDLILLDMGMPPHEHDLDEGLAVLDWLQMHPRSVKVIVLTGQDAERAAYAAVKAGAFDYLQKPVSTEMLEHALKRAQLFLDNERRLREQEQVQSVNLNVPLGQGVKPVRNRAEEQLLRHVLEETGFNIHETARRLNLNRENVYYLLKKYGITRPAQKSDDR